jgi:hypothetical protein
MSRKPEKTATFSSSPWCKFRVSCIMISWEQKCKKMRWLVEHEICPCSYIEHNDIRIDVYVEYL